MKTLKFNLKTIFFLPLFLFFLSLYLFIFESCEDYSLVNATKERVTFDVVFEDNTWDGKTVYADLYENSDPKKYIETMEGIIEPMDNSSHYHVKLTSLSQIKTNEMYFLEIYIDMDENGEKSTNDLQSTIFGVVMAGYIWTEIHVFSSDLELVQ